MRLITLGLIIFLILLGILDMYIPDTNLLQDYIRGTFTETIGIIITLIFVQYILDSNKNKKEKQNEIDKILRRNSLIQYYFSNFRIYAKIITLPDPEPGKSISIEETSLEKNFDFRRLKSIYMPSLSLFDGTEPAFKLFFENHE